MIMAHLGSDMTMDYRECLAAIALAKQYPNVYLDTSTKVITRYLERAVADLPPEKLVYGTDEPEVDTRFEIYKIRVLKLPKKTEEMILGGNMERLLAKYKGGRP
jgi:predicted TIM-barrel fold metal-dependent hydrolase